MAIYYWTVKPELALIDKRQKKYPGLGLNSGYFAHFPERKGKLTQEEA